MKVICAPDSFKESLTAAEAAQAMSRGIRRAVPDGQVDLCPIADGGEGTVDAMLAATNGRPMTTEVMGPLGEKVQAKWGLLGQSEGQPLTAVIEMAAASGLALVPPDLRDPTKTTTFGTGMLMKAALDAGGRRILMGIGGSATNDGGCGMATALGSIFTDAEGRAIAEPGPTGGCLTQVQAINLSNLDARIGQTEIIVACDVTNPMTGPNGAAHIYGPQKGATPQQVEQLDLALGHLAKLMRQQLTVEIEHMPGAGAAGGLGAGLAVFVGAKLEPGIKLVLEAVNFEQRATNCDLCLTGEGRLDGQSLSGKACLGVAEAAKRHDVDTIALVGSVGPNSERCLEAGLQSYHVIGARLSTEESMRRAAELLESATMDLIEARL